MTRAACFTVGILLAGQGLRELDVETIVVGVLCLAYTFWPRRAYEHR